MRPSSCKNHCRVIALKVLTCSSDQGMIWEWYSQDCCWSQASLETGHELFKEMT